MAAPPGCLRQFSSRPGERPSHQGIDEAVTDEDRYLLLDLRRMTDACGAFCAGVIEHDFSRDDQLALSDWLTDMAQRIRA